MLFEKKRKRSTFSFIIALFFLTILALFVLGVEFVTQKIYKPDAKNVSDKNAIAERIDIAASKPRQGAREYTPQNNDTKPAKDSQHPDTIVESTDKEEEITREEGQMIASTSSETSSNPDNKQDNAEKQETKINTNRLITDLSQQPANSLGIDQAGENLPALKILGLNLETIQSLINAGKARLLVMIDDGNGARNYLLKGDNLQELEVAELTKATLAGLSSRRLDLYPGYIANFPSALLEFKIRKQGGPGSQYRISLCFSNEFDAELAALQREALAKASVHADKKSVDKRQRVVTRFRLVGPQNRPELVDLRLD